MGPTNRTVSQMRKLSEGAAVCAYKGVCSMGVFVLGTEGSAVCTVIGARCTMSAEGSINL